MNDFTYSRAEAVSTLTAISRELLPMLDTEGYQAESSSNGQRLALYQLKKLHEGGNDWLEDSSVIHEVGLGRSDVSLMLAALAYQEAKRLRAMHEAGNG